MTPVQNSKYIEDIDSTTGEAVSGGACVVYDITVISDAGGTGVITFHDGDAAADSKLFEVRIAASTTVHCPFPKGKKFSTGLFVKSNVAGLDLAIDYD
jgi:hypothetical protein